MLENLQYNQSKWEMLMAQEMAEETRTEISDADLVDDDLETCSGTNISDSSEMLLPLRRSSLNPTRQDSLKEQLRRFSVPLNVFQDSKFKNRDKGLSSSAADYRSYVQGSPVGSAHSLHSQLSIHGHCKQGHAMSDKVLSSEKLLPDSSIASITTPVQATRLNVVLKEGGTWKLIRQQTFPPLERTHTIAARPLHTSNEDAIYPSRVSKPEIGKQKEGRFSSIFKRNDTDKTDNDDASENNYLDVTESSRNLEKENLDPLTRGSSGTRRDSQGLGSQFRENLITVPLEIIASEQQLQRRKSMPAETGLFSKNIFNVNYIV